MKTKIWMLLLISLVVLPTALALQMNVSYPNEVVVNESFIIKAMVSDTTPGPVYLSLYIGDCKEDVTINLTPISPPADIYYGEYNFSCTLTQPGYYQGFVVAKTSDSEVWRIIEINVSELQSPVYSFTFPQEINLGSSTSQEGDNVSATITITNNGTGTIDSITLTPNMNAGYELHLNVTQISNLSPGDSVNVKVWTVIPSGYGGRSLIGYLIANATAGNLVFAKQASVYLEAQAVTSPELRIRDMDIYVDGDHTDIDPHDEVEVNPGSEVRLEVEVQNRLDVDLRDVYVTIDNTGLDVYEESDMRDLDVNDKYRYELNFSIPYDATEDRYVLNITIYGEDFDGNNYEYSTYIYLRLRRKSHEIKIVSLDLDKSTYKCGGAGKLLVRVANTGRHDEDAAKIEVNFIDLNITATETFSIYEGDTKIIEIPFTLDSNVSTGQYIVEVKAYYDYDKETDSKSTILSLECTETKPTQPQTPVIPPEEQQGEQGQTGGIIVEGVPETRDKLIVIGLVVIAVLLLGILIALLRIVLKA